MLLAVDTGNTQTVLGLFDGTELVSHWRIATNADRTSDEHALIVAQLLDMEGYPVTTAANGAEALAQLDEGSTPSLVLLDMRMPVLDGWGFAEELARRRMRIPIVVMTAARDAQRWAEDISAAAALPKPFGFDELIRTVNEARGAA